MTKKPKRHELFLHKERVSRGFERSRNLRIILPERHLFVTEGTKSEPNYLNGMIDQICALHGNDCRKQFEVYGEGKNTLGLLSKAEQRLMNASDEFQHVWIVYDQDDFPRDHFDNTVKRCEALNQKNPNTQFHALWSNQCVELWFLLHFQYLQSDIERQLYRENLSEALGKKYKKNDPQIFSLLFPNIKTAIKNAKNLRALYSEKTPPSQCAPCTNFYELIEELWPYLKPKSEGKPSPKSN